MSDCHFDKASHTYTLRGVRVPSVTQILQAEGFTHPYKGNGAANRGTQVHKITAAMDRWEPHTVPEELKGYYLAYQNWQAEFPLTFTHIEIPIVNEIKYFAGTPDRIAMTGEVIDIKTGQPEVSHQLQTAGYLRLHESIKARWCLYLHEDSTYDYVQNVDDNDHRVFDNALYNFQWKRRNGIK